MPPSPPPPAWNTNLVIKVNNVVVSPIDNFIPTFNIPVDPLHSLEDDNVAHVAKPATYTFKMDVKAIGNSVATLTNLAVTRTSFTIEASENEGGHDWSFNKITFTNCYITSVASTALIGGVPTVTFNGICLHVDAEAKPAAAGGG